MKDGLQIGQVGELRRMVTPDQTITLGRDMQATVFATPSMIDLMEHAAREALRPYLEPGEESVGVDVDVRHLAATPLGAEVRGVATVTGLDGRHVDFALTAFQGEKQIGEGRHRRAVIRMDRFAQHLETSPGPTYDMAGLKPNTGEMPEFETLVVMVARGVATVTLDRPAVLNAVNRRMTEDLRQLVAWLAGHMHDVRVVILTGNGRAFCSGDDVKELATLDLNEARRLSLQQAQLYLAFEKLPQPIIAAVNGTAAGAGCVCAYSCDFRIASHAAQFGMPEIRLGWPPGYGVAQLTSIVGKSRALDLCLTGRTINAAVALEWGLVNETVPANRLLARAQELASQLLALAPQALRETKRIVHQDDSPHTKLTYRQDTEAYLRCLDTADAREGLQAFQEKRAARFSTGKVER